MRQRMTKMIERLRLLLVLPPLALAQPQAASAMTLHLSLCGGGRIDLQLPHRHGGDSRCPVACHAVLRERGRPGCRDAAE
jgi:hypothetical protein